MGASTDPCGNPFFLFPSSTTPSIHFYKESTVDEKRFNNSRHRDILNCLGYFKESPVVHCVICSCEVNKNSACDKFVFKTVFSELC